MSVTYDGIIASDTITGAVTGDTVTVPLPAGIPGSTPTEAVFLILCEVSVEAAAHIATGSSAKTFTGAITSPYNYTTCHTADDWVDLPAGVNGGATGYVVLNEIAAGGTLVYTLDDAGSGLSSDYKYELRQYRGVKADTEVFNPTLSAFDGRTVTELDPSTTFASAFSLNPPFTGTLDDATFTVPTSTGLIFSVQSGYGMTNPADIGLGACGTDPPSSHKGDTLLYDGTTVGAPVFHDAFTAQSDYFGTLTNSAGSWVAVTSFAHMLNPADGAAVALGADFTSPGFVDLCGPITHHFLHGVSRYYPVVGQAFPLALGAGPAACPVALHAWDRL